MSLQRHLQLIDSTEEGGNRLRLRVAFATSDRKRVDQHFGSACSFVLHDVDQRESRLVGLSEFGTLARDGNEAKLVEKLELLDGCDAVYCQAVGHSAVQQLLARGIQPIKVPGETPIADLLSDLQGEIASDHPPLWLKRLYRRRECDRGRFDEMGEEWLE